MQNQHRHSNCFQSVFSCVHQQIKFKPEEGIYKFLTYVLASLSCTRNILAHLYQPTLTFKIYEVPDLLVLLYRLLWLCPNFVSNYCTPAIKLPCLSLHEMSLGRRWFTKICLVSISDFPYWVPFAIPILPIYPQLMWPNMHRSNPFKGRSPQGRVVVII